MATPTFFTVVADFKSVVADVFGDSNYSVLAEAQKQVAAINAVLDAHPNILKEVQKAHEAQPDPAVVEEQAQDEARANALKRLLEQSPITAPPAP